MTCGMQDMIIGLKRLYLIIQSSQFIILTPTMSLKGQEALPQQNILSQFSIRTVLPFQIIQRSSKKLPKYHRDGHWNEKQHLKYAIFLTYFQKLFEDPLKKKSVRIYQMMADVIITRNSDQCRSHHQKMEKYRGTIANIVTSVAQKYEPRVYKQLETKYLVLIKLILENQAKYIRDLTKPKRQKDKEKDQILKEVQKNQNQNDSNHSEDQIINNLENQSQVSKNKLVNVKTAQSYAEANPIDQNLENSESIRFMPIQGQERHEEQGAERSIQINQADQSINFYNYQQPILQNEHFSYNIGVQLTLQGKLAYEDPIKVLEMKRSVHVQNSQMLLGQLAYQKQMIQQYDSALRLYQQSFRSSYLN